MSARTARICVIRCHYYRDTRLQREVSAMLDRGHAVHVLCLRDAEEPIRESRNGLTITRIPFAHRAGAGNVRRLAEYAAFFVLAGVLVTALHLRRRLDLVQVNSVPDALVFAAVVPRMTGARVVLDLQEPFPEFFAARSGVEAGHWMVRLIGRMEQLSIRFADAVVTVTEPMRQVFIERGASPEKITVVMDGSDDRTFDPHRHPRRPRDRDRFVLVSHGTIEPHYGLDTAIRAVAGLSSVVPSIELHIVGDGSQRAELQRLAVGLGVADQVHFSPGFVPIDELVARLADADLGIVAMTRNPFRDLTLAGKMFDFITMGVPMVVSTTRSVQSAFPPGCFEPFVADDARDLAKAIVRVYANPTTAKAQATRAREVARPYSWAAQRERYHEVIDAQLGRGRRQVQVVSASAEMALTLPETG